MASTVVEDLIFDLPKKKTQQSAVYDVVSTVGAAKRDHRWWDQSDNWITFRHFQPVPSARELACLLEKGVNGIICVLAQRDPLSGAYCSYKTWYTL